MSENASRTGLAKEPITHNCGIIKVPQGPGPRLGIEINREVLAKYS
jgi:L-alanine-DL-glutamate epimerase-like enolase superfamily enzyme